MASELLERELYGGKFHATHNPEAKGRQPRYVITEGKTVTKPKGVTTIISKVIAKDLVSWAVGMAQDYLREKLPVITEEDVVAAGKAYMTRRDAGASTGTEAHALVENYLKGKINLTAVDEASDEARKAYNAFVAWFESVDAEVINVEEVIYSQEFEYAGTYDCMLKINGKVYLCDLKTTNASKRAPNGVYAENFLQLGAYANAHDEQREYEETHQKAGVSGTTLLPVEGLMVISAKKNGVLDIVTNEDLGITLDDCKTMWKRVVNIYTFMEYLTKRLGGK